MYIAISSGLVTTPFQFPLLNLLILLNWLNNLPTDTCSYTLLPSPSPSYPQLPQPPHYTPNYPPATPSHHQPPRSTPQRSLKARALLVWVGGGEIEYTAKAQRSLGCRLLGWAWQYRNLSFKISKLSNYILYHANLSFLCIFLLLIWHI